MKNALEREWMSPIFNNKVFLATSLIIFLSTSTPTHSAESGGGRITGTVTESGTGLPIPALTSSDEAFIQLYSSIGLPLDIEAFLDSTGTYTFAGLPSGTYYVRTSLNAYLDELYGNAPCAFIGCDVTVGTAVSVTAGQTTSGVDIAVGRGGRITGTVTESGSGAPIPALTSSDEAFIQLYSSIGLLLDIEAFLDSTGTYTFAGLPSGTYYVRTSLDAYLDELYGDVPCAFTGCDVTAGTAVSVTEGETTSGIDIAVGSHTTLFCDGFESGDPSRWSSFSG